MGKILSLDVGDQWIGIAITDKLNFLAKPLTTIAQSDIENYLQKLIEIEKIEKIIIGYPKTMKGTDSEQTKKIICQKQRFESLIPSIPFILWDERLSSKRAQEVKPAKTKDDKLKSHAIAAAFILDSYLGFLRMQNNY